MTMSKWSQTHKSILSIWFLLNKVQEQGKLRWQKWKFLTLGEESLAAMGQFLENGSSLYHHCGGGYLSMYIHIHLSKLIKICI